MREFRLLCEEYGFSDIWEGEAVRGIVARHANGFRATVTENGTWCVYRRLDGDRVWSGFGPAGLSRALAGASRICRVRLEGARR